MLRHRGAAKADLKFVMKRLSAVSRQELEHAGIPVETATKMMLQAMKSSESWVFLDRAEPMAVLIFDKLGAHRYSTMFMATETFFGERGRPSLYLRRFLDERFDANPELELESRTYSKHPELDRWYEMMRYEPGRREGAATVFTRQATASGM